MDGGVVVTPAAAAAATATNNNHPVATKKRRVFYVKLSSTECTEVDYKDLVRDYERVHGVPSATASVAKPRTIDTTASDPESAANSPFPEEMVGGLPLSTPRTQRFDIIEHLEKRYGAGAVVGRAKKANGADAEDGAGKDDGFVRGDDDDLYDSEDSFIDDEELHQNIEEIHTQARVKTKHSGFFVNAGDAIETIEGEDPADEEDDGAVAPAGKKAKKAKKSGGAEATKASRAFVDEWSDAASDWQPGADIVEGIETLRRAVRELGTPFTKTFPRQLDDPLRAVDRLVVDAHPNKWRVNGYFATLMTFLPFTKQYLKTNMLRLEARDATRAIKEEIENAIESMAAEIDVYAKRAEGGAVEEIKEELLKDKEIALSLHRLLLMLDEWITKENDYRQMLKSDDKKLMKEADYTLLNARQERNRLFNRVLALFPPGLMDLPSLRGLSKAGKAKGARKPAAVTKVTATNKSPTSTPKKKLPVVVVAEVVAAAPAKRSIKPFKSRLMDEAPPFRDEDFEEIQ